MQLEGQDELFPEAVVEKKAPEPTKTIPSKGMGWCPAHTGGKETGMILIGDHLVWRPHTRKHHSGSTMECPASLVAICNAKPRPDSVWVDPKTGKKPVCPHDKPKGYHR